MANPTLADVVLTQVGNDPGGSTPFSYVLSLGSYTVNQGIIFFVGIDGNSGTITVPAGWTVKAGPTNDGGSNVHGVIFARKMDGTEGTTITLQTANAQRLFATRFRVNGYDGTQVCYAALVGSAGTSTTPDPPNVAPGIGSVDWLAISVFAKDTLDSNASAYPAGYSDGTNVDDGNSGQAAAGVAGAYATRTFTGSSEDPGTFTIGESEQWVAGTILVPPGSDGSADTAITVDSASMVAQGQAATLRTAMNVGMSGAPFEGSSISLLFSAAFVLQVVHGQATFEGQEIPFIISKPYTEGEGALEGQEIDLQAQVSLPIVKADGAFQGQTIGLLFGGDTSMTVTPADAVFQRENVTLTATGQPATSENILQTPITTIVRKMAFSLLDITHE